MGATLVEIDADLPEVTMPVKKTLAEEFEAVIKDCISDEVTCGETKVRIARAAGELRKVAMLNLYLEKMRTLKYTKQAPMERLSEIIEDMRGALRELEGARDGIYEIIEMVEEEYDGKE